VRAGRCGDYGQALIDLANADRDRVLAMWAGLGYYARARNLHKCAGIIRDEFGGVFPGNEAELLKLPGIGPYSAATIAAICYEEPTNVVDGNVRAGRCGDYGQALIDLGGTVCTPRNPKCGLCPWQAYCQAFAHEDMEDYPKKAPKKKLPIRYGAVFVLRYTNNVLGDEAVGDEIWLERRPDEGLLGGMMGFGGSDWGDKPDDPMAHAPLRRNWEAIEGEIRHIFTHFDLRLIVYTAQTSEKTRMVQNQAGTTPQGLWAKLAEIDKYALPTVFKKVLDAALKE